MSWLMAESTYNFLGDSKKVAGSKAKVSASRYGVRIYGDFDLGADYVDAQLPWRHFAQAGVKTTTGVTHPKIDGRPSHRFEVWASTGEPDYKKVARLVTVTEVYGKRGFVDVVVDEKIAGDEKSAYRKGALGMLDELVRELAGLRGPRKSR